MDDETIGHRLRAAIAHAGYSMRNFAKAAGLPYRSVQSYASDQQKPGTEALLKMRNTLQISIDWLLCGEEKPSFDFREPGPREATLGDITEICKLIEKFENPKDVAITIASLMSMPSKLLAPIRKMNQQFTRFSKMAVRLREHQIGGSLDDVDLDTLKMREIPALYEREFGKPDF